MTTPIGPVTPTKDPRVRILNGGPQNWRTEVKDCSGEWAITGPPYATKDEAFTYVDATIAWSF
jgi:hypothetical protein